MSRARDFSRGSKGLTLCRAAILCVTALGLVLSRSVPPSFSITSTHANVKAPAGHGHRLCFDYENSQWMVRASVILTTPPPSRSPHLTDTSEPLVDMVTDGLHYNRPPPAS